MPNAPAAPSISLEDMLDMIAEYGETLLEYAGDAQEGVLAAQEVCRENWEHISNAVTQLYADAGLTP